MCKTTSPKVLCHYIDCVVDHITYNIIPLHGLRFEVCYPPHYHLLTEKAFSSEELYSNGSIIVTSNRRISVKINRAAVQLCLVNTSLFCVVSCIVRSVHEFDFRLVINRTTDKWLPLDSDEAIDRDMCF